MKSVCLPGPFALVHACLLTIALALTGCSTPRPTTETTRDWHVATLGLCEDYPEETRSLAAARTDLAEARRSGAQVLRIAFGWDAIEPERGRFDWRFWDDFVRVATEEYGITLIPYVCYTPRWAATDAGDDHWRSPPRDPEDFARFMAAIVARYKHAVAFWELWNEPDNPAYWRGTREQFARLVHAGARAVRATDPRATIVLGGIATETDFLEGLFAEDRVAPSVDVVNLHSYFETWHSDTIETLPDYVARAADIVREHGEDEPLWMAEVGYSSVGRRPRVSDVYHARYSGEHTAEAQATALARTLVLALSTGRLPLVAWYRVNDLPPAEDVIGDDNNRHLGVRTVAGKTKPAFDAFALLTRWFSQPYQILTPELRVNARGDPVQAHAFRLQDERIVLAVWIGTPETRPVPDDTEAVLPPSVDRRRASLELRVPTASVGDVRVTNAQGAPLERSAVRCRTSRGAARLDLRLRGGELLLVELHPGSR